MSTSGPIVDPVLAELYPELAPIIQEFICCGVDEFEEKKAVLTKLMTTTPEWWLKFTETVEPSIVIGGTKEDPYMRRWHMIRRNAEANIYLHHFRHDDDDRAMHSHPSTSLSLLLSGRLREIDEKHPEGRVLEAGAFRIRTPAYYHRIIVEEPGYTLFSTGPVTSDWFFKCPDGRRHFSRFIDTNDYGRVGVGCAEYQDEGLERTPLRPEFSYLARK